ncbi:TetR/AcrR family transcriptional regulator [Mycetocola tolaasinivorans]|uniref:TetR/AcrR family transcriptional regulator n=1 Tax=Mycetocola tolaasinivorans TaxID=76635 RepID=A0A3L7A548_9MICO|nr:TetR/AcrR family transcriptional regulator [Mycetocola tolaasinivorans]RLP75357.1 TetR/AcrR family transcriptional regulator [Mycetocola tolaasinivorans]
MSASAPVAAPKVSKTKRAILDAALELSARSGITGTTMDDVALEAGVAKGSVYYNFSSKDQLFEALLDDGLCQFHTFLVEVRGELTGVRALHALIEGTLDRVRDNQAMAKLLVAELFRTDRVWKESLQRVRSQLIGVFAEALRDIDGGELHAAEIRASAIFGAVIVAGLEWVVFDPERTRDETVDGILSVFSGAYNMGH